MASSEPWRYRCPNGHAYWKLSKGDDSPGNYKCGTCDEHFDELRDMKLES